MKDEYDVIKDLSDDELLLRLAHQLAARDRDALPRLPKELLDLAETWLAQHMNELQRLICTSDRVHNLYNDGETPTLVAAVADLISSICVGVSPLTVAYLLTRFGLRKLCSELWTK
jgi:hypothetical protein